MEHRKIDSASLLKTAIEAEIIPILNDTSSSFKIEKSIGIKESKAVEQKQSKRIRDPGGRKQRRSIRNLWRKRNARSIDEGIRREHTIDSLRELKEELVTPSGQGSKINNNRFVASTIAGLISALAEESSNLEVEVDVNSETPIWSKSVRSLKVSFSRLGFRQLKMGGLNGALPKRIDKPFTRDGEYQVTMKDDILQTPSSPMEAFDRIDVDKSGSLDKEEIAMALKVATGNFVNGIISSVNNSTQNNNNFSKLASRLVRIYDVNGDGVVDRDEYKNMVQDMTTLRREQSVRQKERKEKQTRQREKMQKRIEKKMKQNDIKAGGNGELVGMKGEKRQSLIRVLMGFNQWRKKDVKSTLNEPDPRNILDNESINTFSKEYNILQDSADSNLTEDAFGSDFILNNVIRGEGSIIFSDMKLDLRRLLFGAIPGVKKIIPGGPLVLEPMTMTVTASLNRKDILESLLIDDGLRRLVARALRRRVRGVRDLVDGAVFFGRTWNGASKIAPMVEVPNILNIEFDKSDRLIITGRAKFQASPDQPIVENSFKLRTTVGTLEHGQKIYLKQPELALIVECPNAWERNIVSACNNFDLPIPSKPEPLYAFFPLVSPLKQTEQDGFNLGEDNKIKSIFIQDGALRLEISTVLRPGRFLGNHYLAFTFPNRSFILTIERVMNGIKQARKNKREKEDEKLKAEERAGKQALSSQENVDASLEIQANAMKNDLSFVSPADDFSASVESTKIVEIRNKPGFFSRFLEGYLEAAREEHDAVRKDKMKTAISDFFGGSEGVDE